MLLAFLTAVCTLRLAVRREKRTGRRCYPVQPATFASTERGQVTDAQHKGLPRMSIGLLLCRELVLTCAAACAPIYPRSSSAAPHHGKHTRRNSVGVQTDSDDDEKRRGRQRSTHGGWDEDWDAAINDAYPGLSDDDRTPRQSTNRRL
jgi:hypothetical protein